jgi:hypothetical protein
MRYASRIHTRLVSTAAVEVIAIMLAMGCRTDIVSSPKRVKPAEYEATKTVNTAFDHSGAVIQSQTETYPTPAPVTSLPGWPTSKFDARPRALVLHPPTEVRFDEVLSPSELAYQGFVIAITDPDNGRPIALEMTMDGTGEAIQRVSFYDQNHKLWSARMDWTPISSGIVATRVEQTEYTNEVIARTRVDTYDAVPASNTILMPSEGTYEIPLGRALLTPLGSSSPKGFFRGGHLIFQSESLCGDGTRRFLAAITNAIINRAALRAMNVPDGPMEALNAHEMVSGLQCFLFFAKRGSDYMYSIQNWGNTQLSTFGVFFIAAGAKMYEHFANPRVNEFQTWKLTLIHI